MEDAKGTPKTQTRFEGLLSQLERQVENTRILKNRIREIKTKLCGEAPKNESLNPGKDMAEPPLLDKLRRSIDYLESINDEQREIAEELESII